MVRLAPAALVCALSALVATLPTVAGVGGYCSAYGGYYCTPGYYGSDPVFLNKPQLILPPVHAPAPAPSSGAWWQGSSSQASPPATPACSVYVRTYSTGTNTGHLTMVVSDTSSAAFEAPYTLVFANPSITGIDDDNTNNSPSSTNLGNNGVVTSTITSVIPAQGTNTLDYDLTSSASDATYNPSSAYAPNWVSINGIPCTMVTGF